MFKPSKSVSLLLDVLTRGFDVNIPNGTFYIGDEGISGYVFDRNVYLTEKSLSTISANVVEFKIRNRDIYLTIEHVERIDPIPDNFNTLTRATLEKINDIITSEINLELPEYSHLVFDAHLIEGALSVIGTGKEKIYIMIDKKIQDTLRQDSEGNVTVNVEAKGMVLSEDGVVVYPKRVWQNEINLLILTDKKLTASVPDLIELIYTEYLTFKHTSECVISVMNTDTDILGLEPIVAYKKTINIVTSSVFWDKMKKCIKKKVIFVVFPLTFFIEGKKKIRFAVYDTKSKEIEHYGTPIPREKEFERRFMRLFRIKNGPRSISKISAENTFKEPWFMYWWTDLRLTNPNVSKEELIYEIKKNISDIPKVVTNYVVMLVDLDKKTGGINKAEREKIFSKIIGRKLEETKSKIGLNLTTEIKQTNFAQSLDLLRKDDVPITHFKGTHDIELAALYYLTRKHKNQCVMMIVAVSQITKDVNFQPMITTYKHTDRKTNIIQTVDENFWRGINECKSKRFVIFPLTLRNYIDGEFNRAHLNFLVYDRKAKELERFEPHGYSNVSDATNLFDETFPEQFKKHIGKESLTKYYSPEKFCYLTQFQGIEQEGKKAKGDPVGFCAAWSLWWGDVRLSNPNIPRRHLIEYAHMGIIDFKKFIRSYAEYIYRIFEAIDGKNVTQRDKIIDEILSKEFHL
uniref:Uncharacterized protein n=1 Tax=Pithovirus LCDPAC01 TaxID=2506600 RepID=A0A481YN35_9VIRU|nr:MAG: protein of unknown function DUF917 [Pithovirus LCDPAC01]